MMHLRDSFGRKINYLRLSVTDRCNLRCSYCMPEGGISAVQHQDVLKYEELLRIAEAAVAIGVEKIRVTGGEPLVRKGITGFLARLAKIPGLKRLVLTTNGVLLPEMAREIRDAGVESLNISLDSLEPATFARITRVGDLRQVLNGIAAAEEAGFPFVKINMVVMRGVNDHEVLEFAAMTINKPYRVRFIEYMPTAANAGGRLTVSGDEVMATLSRRYWLQPVEREETAGPSISCRIAGAKGTVGVITPVSCHFCNECNRIRVTSTGIAKSCLFGKGMVDMKPFLALRNRFALESALHHVVYSKPLRHNLGLSDRCTPTLHMSQVGG